VGLTSQTDTRLLQANPTIAAGDFKVSTDGGAFASLGTLPVVTPAAGKSVKITLSAAEMTGDNITVVCSDAAGAEWCDQIINIQTSARQIDDLAFPTVSGRSLDVTAAGEAGIDWANIGSPTTAQTLSGTSTKALEPTTAGRKLDVSTGGEAGLDWANIGAPTTTVALTGTTIAASAATLSAGERNAIADALLDRDMATGTDSGSPTVRTPRQALRFLRNAWAVAATVLTVMKEDDATPSWTAVVTVNSSAQPITGSDPAS
jgi:hypothetical protein